MLYVVFLCIEPSLYDKWKQLNGVVHHLDQTSQRAILGQLMIMANARSKETRFKMLHKASDSLLDVCRGGGVDSEIQKSAGQMIIYMGQFARLNSKHRKKFGKWVFSAISELYKPTKASKETKREAKIIVEEEKEEIITEAQDSPKAEATTVRDCE
jgi:hypothetical protein